MHIPHGGVGLCAPVTIARRVNRRAPPATAEPSATRAAQTLTGNEAFYTLQP